MHEAIEDRGTLEVIKLLVKDSEKITASFQEKPPLKILPTAALSTRSEQRFHISWKKTYSMTDVVMSSEKVNKKPFFLTHIT